MKNLISYSLWGDNPIYWKGAIRNIEQSKEFFPGWICRFYIDNNSNQELIDTIKGENVEIVLMEKTVYYFKNLSERFNHSGLFWRFLPLMEEDVNIVLSRDCDSRLSEREVSAVTEWINSEKDFHIMRDHPYHTVPILAGMWGARNGILKDINQLLENWYQFPNKGRYHAEDQDFLGQIVYEKVQDKSLEHSEFGIKFANETFKFPKKRVNFEFVGDVYDINDDRHPEYWKILKFNEDK